MRRAVLTFLILVQIDAQAFGCNYGINLANPSTYWGSVLSNHRLPFVANKGIVSQGPFLIDTNHRERALLIGPLVVWTQGGAGPEKPLGDIDLTNTRIKIRIKMEYTPRENEVDPRVGGKLVFWFQSRLSRKAVAGGDFEMPWRTANYVYNTDLMPEGMSERTVEIPVTPDLNQWTCLGNNPIDLRPFIGSAANYTCALNQEEFAEAMAHPVDMGALFLLPSQRADGSNLSWLRPDRPARTETMENAAFILEEFTIERDSKPVDELTDANSCNQSPVPAVHTTAQGGGEIPVH